MRYQPDRTREVASPAAPLMEDTRPERDHPPTVAARREGAGSGKGHAQPPQGVCVSRVDAKANATATYQCTTTLPATSRTRNRTLHVGSAGFTVS
jgi:hypothetical protein